MPKAGVPLQSPTLTQEAKEGIPGHQGARRSRRARRTVSVTTRYCIYMLWLVLLASHSSLADDSPTPLAKVSALSAPQRRDLPADTTAKDAATKPPRDSASPDATMKRQLAYLQSKALVSEAAPAWRALSEMCGACAINYTLNNGATTSSLCL